DAREPRDADDDDDLDHHEPERERVYGSRLYDRGAPRWTRINAPAHRVLPPASRDALIAGIAEALLLERALPQLLDPAGHVVTCVVSRLGATASAGGVAIVVRALATEAWLDDAAALTVGGAITALPRDLAAVRDVALTLRGLFVRAALDNDHGTWMIR